MFIHQYDNMRQKESIHEANAPGAASHVVTHQPKFLELHSRYGNRILQRMIEKGNGHVPIQLMEMDVDPDFYEASEAVAMFPVKGIKANFVQSFATELDATVYHTDDFSNPWDIVARYHETSKDGKHAEEHLMTKIQKLIDSRSLLAYVEVQITINNSPCGNDDPIDHNCIEQLEDFAMDAEDPDSLNGIIQFRWIIKAANYYKYNKDPNRYKNLMFSTVEGFRVIDEDIEDAVLESREAFGVRHGYTEDEIFEDLAAVQELMWSRQQRDMREWDRLNK